jgi:hypothetical protein
MVVDLAGWLAGCLRSDGGVYCPEIRGLIPKCPFVVSHLQIRDIGVSQESDVGVAAYSMSRMLQQLGNAHF